MKAKEIIAALEAYAPPVYQESYDNAGIQCGDPDMEVTGVLLTLDITEAVITEALERGCNLVVAHHPLIFSGLKKVTPATAVGRALMRAIRAGVVLYATHTNLDNMRWGVNAILAEKLGLEKTSILSMKRDVLRQLYTFVPHNAANAVRDALFAAGAGRIDKYDECSYNIEGHGTFRPREGANPVIGEQGKRERVAETKIEVLVQHHLEGAVLKALFESHPYEEVAYGFINLHNANQEMGAGMIGELKDPAPPAQFLQTLKAALGAGCIRHTALCRKQVQKVAVCGGAGSFLLNEAIGAGADVLVTADYKYHQFFDADGRIIIADAGHWETEQFVPELLGKMLRDKFPTFAVLLSRVNTNPVHYFT